MIISSFGWLAMPMADTHKQQLGGASPDRNEPSPSIEQA
jgi:hypothetical protein